MPKSNPDENQPISLRLATLEREIDSVRSRQLELIEENEQFRERFAKLEVTDDSGKINFNAGPVKMSGSGKGLALMILAMAIALGMSSSGKLYQWIAGFLKVTNGQ